MGEQPRFIFATCQVGAEAALKAELARHWPELRLAFSRPGFLTFKLPEGHRLRADFELAAVFARAYGFCLGRVRGTEAQMIEALWRLFGTRPFRRIHVWQRDQRSPGEFDFEPAITPAARQVHAALIRSCPRPEALHPQAARLDQPAERGEFVLDCVLVEPDEWWVGYHRARDVLSCFPGGLMALELPAEAVSRAWLKMEQALHWSQLPIRPGARVAELGCAPGGASQCLLQRGYRVLGIDPAEMHPRVLAHADFTHLRRRVRHVRRREFRKVRWLTSDMNVAPRFTLDAVEDIVTYPEVNVRGLLLTLKLPKWTLADKVPEYFARIRSWGYNQVSARQLQYNRQEISVAALKRPFRRKPAMVKVEKVSARTPSSAKRRKPRQGKLGRQLPDRGPRLLRTTGSTRGE